MEEEKNKIKPWLAGIIIFLCASNIFTALFFNREKIFLNLGISNQLHPQKEIVDGSALADNIISENNNETEKSTSTNTEDLAGDISSNQTASPVIDNASGAIIVDWFEWPDEVWKGESLTSELNDVLKGEKTVYNNRISQNPKEYYTYKVYKVGTISAGPYQSNDLYLLIFQEIGNSFFRFIKENDDLILLSDNEMFGDYFKLNKNIRISNLLTTEKISFPDPKFSLTRKGGAVPLNYGKFVADDYIELSIAFTYDRTRKVYTDKSGCYYAKDSDGTLAEYELDIPFAKSQDSSVQDGSASLDLTWNDGSRNENYYIVNEIGGCGTHCYNKNDFSKINNQVEVSGLAANGDKIYELKKNIIAENGTWKEFMKNMYDSYFPGYDDKKDANKEKISYDEFLKRHPVIFWEGPNHEYFMFRNADFLPGVECGKPVIYLYPETPTDIQVKVTPSGGFKLTEPFYGEGWYVNAKPTGEIYNYNNGGKYDYLFWEGFGLNYKRPEEGFVVAKNEVKDFLIKKLLDLGLIEKEYNEFIDFWLPKMQDRNYYFITFIPQQEFDKIAPLNIEPRPETVIRVFMDYQGLDKMENVRPQRITTPIRRGFTVVEWGGALHK